MDYQRDEHRMHLIVCHLVFCPKRRKAVLGGAIAQDCERLIRQKCTEKGWQALALAIRPVHVHLFIRVFPTPAAAEVVKEIKGLTSLRQKHPVLLRLPSLWTRSSFASTAGNVSEETIRRSIEA
jgi:putative transposase